MISLYNSTTKQPYLYLNVKPLCIIFSPIIALLCFELLIPKAFLRLQKYGSACALLSFIRDELSEDVFI